MTTPEHEHALRDADGRPPVVTGTPPTRIAMPTPISCAGCDADQDTLVNDLNGHGHTVTWWLVADVVLP